MVEDVDGGIKISKSDPSVPKKSSVLIGRERFI